MKKLTKIKKNLTKFNKFKDRNFILGAASMLAAVIIIEGIYARYQKWKDMDVLLENLKHEAGVLVK